MIQDIKKIVFSNRFWFYLSIFLATFFLFVGDGVAHDPRQTFSAFIVNYFHTLTWILMAIFFFLQLKPHFRLSPHARFFGFGALFTYVLFQLARMGVL